MPLSHYLVPYDGCLSIEMSFPSPLIITNDLTITHLGQLAHADFAARYQVGPQVSSTDAPSLLLTSLEKMGEHVHVADHRGSGVCKGSPAICPKGFIVASRNRGGSVDQHGHGMTRLYNGI